MSDETIARYWMGVGAVILTLCVIVVTHALFTHNNNARGREAACNAAGGAYAHPTGVYESGCFKITIQYEPLPVENWRLHERE